MKKLSVVLMLLCISFSFSANGKWGRMPHVYVATYAVDDYSKYKDRTTPLQMSKKHKNVFVNNVFKVAKARFPSINVAHTYDREDASATDYNYRNDLISRSDIVYFAGHGNQQLLALYDKKFDISKRPLGGNTLWAVFDACLVLNVNKNGSLDQPLSTQTIDYSKVDKIRKVFNGVHAVLGNYANGKQYYVANADVGSSLMPSEFATLLFTNGYNVWEAYRTAVGRFFYSKSKYDNQGLMPAIAFLRGYDENGVYHDTSMESVDNVYNAPLKISGSMELFVMYDKFGTPSFDF